MYQLYKKNNLNPPCNHKTAMFTKRTAVIAHLKLSTPALTTNMLIFSASAGVDEACTGVEDNIGPL